MTTTQAAPLMEPMGSFRTCTKCKSRRHLAQFPVLGTGGRSPICVCCPPHTNGGGLYQQSVPVAPQGDTGEKYREPPYSFVYRRTAAIDAARGKK